MRNRFLAKGITLEMLLTQYAHHAHDNAAPAAHHRGGGHDDYYGSDSGDDDEAGAGASPSGGTRSSGGGAGGGSAGSAGSDDEGSSPSTHAHHAHAQHPQAQQAQYQASRFYRAAAAQRGGAGAAAYGYQAPPPHLQLRVQTSRLSLGGARCGSAGAGVSGEDDDCCETFDFHYAHGAEPSPNLHATGVSPYPRGPSCLDEAYPQDNTIQGLLDEFAAAGAAAAAAAAAASAGLEDVTGGVSAAAAAASVGAAAVAAAEAAEDDVGAPDVDAAPTAPAAAWPLLPLLRTAAGSDYGSKRDLASSLSGAADAVGSPLKRLRLGGAAHGPFGSVTSDDCEDELPICYADQRAASCLGRSSLNGSGSLPSSFGGFGFCAPVVVRQQHSSELALPQPREVDDDHGRGIACGAAAAVPPTPATASALTHALPAAALAADVAPFSPCGGAPATAAAAAAPLELLDALPCSIRSCLADAAGLYLANDASGLAA